MTRIDLSPHETSEGAAVSPPGQASGMAAMATHPHSD
jgi:cytochrome o ubiquinol oxidase subunit 2